MYRAKIFDLKCQTFDHSINFKPQLQGFCKGLFYGLQSICNSIAKVAKFIGLEQILQSYDKDHAKVSDQFLRLPSELAYYFLRFASVYKLSG